MRIVPLPQNSLHPGRPAPFSLRDGKGNLLMRRGVVLQSGRHIEGLAQNGLWVEANEADAFVRSGMGTVATLPASLPTCAALRTPATAAADRPAASLPFNPQAQAAQLAYWQQLRERSNSCLREPRAPGFLDGLRALREELVQQLEQDTDRTLFALIGLASSSNELYSATHALLCCAVATLAARQLAGWTPANCESLGLAALSMDVWMTKLQDELARQPGPPSIAQRVVLTRHANGSAELLKELGVSDGDWLDAVEHHHAAACGPLANRRIGMRMARLLQRADQFATMISPRTACAPVSAAMAAQAIYLGEDGRPDEAGMLMIKALGIIPPACRVRLQDGRIGVVLRRGARANAPVLAVLADQAGQALDAQAVRASVSADNCVRIAIAPSEAGVSVPFDTLLAFGR